MTPILGITASQMTGHLKPSTAELLIVAGAGGGAGGLIGGGYFGGGGGAGGYRLSLIHI